MEYHLETPGTQQQHSQPLQARTHDKPVLICPDSLLVVDSIRGKAQKGRRHKWTGSSGPVTSLGASRKIGRCRLVRKFPFFQSASSASKTYQRHPRERLQGCGKMGKMGQGGIRNLSQIVSFFSDFPPISYEFHTFFLHLGGVPCAVRKVGHSPPPVGSFLGVGLPQGTIAIVYPCSINPPLSCVYVPLQTGTLRPVYGDTFSGCRPRGIIFCSHFSDPLLHSPWTLMLEIGCSTLAPMGCEFLPHWWGLRPTD